MTVYCLNVELGAPVSASDPYIHLDSFLSYASAVDELGYEGLDELEDSGEPDYFEDSMPLAQYEIDGEWVWAASSASIADPDADEFEDMSDNDRWSITRWRTRFDNDPEHQIKNTHVQTKSGPFKSYNAALPYSGVDNLDFYFEVADENEPEEVLDLIEEYVPAIGKKRTQGFGEIQDVKLCEAATVESAILHDQRILRTFPNQFIDGTVKNVPYQARTVRPPYWHQDNQVEGGAVPPFAQIYRDDFKDALIEQVVQ